MGAVIVGGMVAAGTGCSSEPVVEEPKGETTSELSTCEVLASAAGATVAVTVYSATATGTCAVGAAAVTVASGGVAAAGSVVCLAPAAAATLSGLAALLTAGATYLVCGEVESQIESAAEEEAAPAAESELTCTPAEHRDLARRKGIACDNLPNSCESLVRSSGGGAAICIGLTGRRNEYAKCRAARQEVIDRCFGGTATDRGHQQQLDDMDRLTEECDAYIAEICPTG
ncbi:MAG: hypothetical protein KIT84_19620 [Labilithrix sp.]|nr:hypothetical protein [Labilithrix sp.]